jgi:hypothetical protein
MTWEGMPSTPCDWRHYNGVDGTPSRAMTRVR